MASITMLLEHQGEDLGEPVTSCTAKSGKVYTISPEGWVE